MAEQYIWNNMILDPKVITKRNQLKRMMDDFTSFSWRGCDAFDSFGAFIINNREDLKFYNGANFKNEYSKAQFGKTSNIIGINYEVQQISFKIGVYYITEQNYREFLYWLNPEIVDNLSFNFESRYRYRVKLAHIQDSTRYIIDRLNSGEPVYYTELTLNFEVQGEPCAIGKENYTMTPWIYNVNNQYTCRVNTDIVDIPKSDLATPIIVNAVVDLQLLPSETFNGNNITIICNANYENENINLFTINLKNLAIETSHEHYFAFKYDSESGLLFLKIGNASGVEKLLNLLNTTDSGEKIIDSFVCNKFKVPGLFDYKDFDYNNFSFTIQIQDGNINRQWLKTEESEIIFAPRTTLI